jgi:sugar lactone lactonase YvrE
MLDYVKYESGGLSFEYPGTCRIESRPNFQLVLHGPDDLRIYFQTTLIPELSEANNGETTLAAVLQDILPRLPQLVSGEKFFSAGCSGLTARIEYEHPDLTGIIWAVIISKPDGTVLQRASLIIVVPPAAAEAQEETIRRILDSFSIGRHAVTDLHISFGRIEQFEFDPQAVIGTRKLSSQTSDVPLTYSENEISTVSADELAVPDAFQPTEELPDPSRITPPHTVVPPEILAALEKPAPPARETVAPAPEPPPAPPLPPVTPPASARGRDHASAADPKAFTVVTLSVGNGGYVDGPLALAKFLRPNGITTDPQGNLYIADFGGHRIRRISVDGIVSTVAGSGAPGFRDEPGNLAQFNGPRGIVYVSGFLYVADLNNARIRRITLDGTVATHAGDGVEGFRDGGGKQAQFDAPRAIAADFAGNLYVADGARVRMVAPNGTVSTIGGNEPGYQDGPTRDARFNILSGIALDRVGNIYVADAGNKCLRRLSRDGTVTTLPVGPGSRVATPILHPVAVTAAIDGTLYVLDGEDFSVKCVFPDGSVARIAGTGRQGHRDGHGGDGETAAEFWMPTGLALFKNRLYVTDREQHAVRLVRIPEIGDMVVKNEPATAQDVSVERRNPVAPLIPTGRSLAAVEDYRPTKPSTAVSAPGKSSGSGVPPYIGQRVPTSRLPEEYIVTTLAGGVAGYCDGVGPGVRFNNPMGLCIDQDGTLFIADHFNHCVRGMTRDGDVLTVAGSLNNGWRDGVGQDARFKGPLCTAVGPEGEIFISDHLNACIRVMTRGGEVRTLAGSGMQRQQDGLGRAAQFEGPKGIAVDATGRVYVADGVTIRTITPDGRVTTLAGGIRGFRDGRGTQAMFGWPYALALDAEGNCYVTDAANHAIRRVTPDGEVTTVYGGGEMRQMNFPSGIALDATGVIYVSDTNNHRVLRLDPTPDRLGVTASTVCGGRRGTRMGNGVDTELDGPRGIAVGPDGEVYVADSGAHRVIKISALKVVEAEKPLSGPTGTLRLDNLSPAAQAMVISSSGIDAVAPEQPVTVGDESFHESVSVPREITDFAERMERHGDVPDGPAAIQSSPGMPETPAETTAENVSPPRPAPPRKVAATILGWGMELKGNNIIRTEPDGTLFLDTTYGPENSAFLYQPWEVTADQTVIVEVRMQLIAYAGERNTTGCAVWVENDRHADAMLIQPEGIRFQRVPELFHPLDTRGQAHTYTITMRGPNIRVAVDGVDAIIGEGKFHERPAAKAGFQPRRWLAFGDGSGTAGSAARWEFIRYRVESGKPPAEVDTLEPPAHEEE